MMTLNKVWSKLRKRNQSQYRQFQFCVGFAVLLITSYLMMLMSPLVQGTLPAGGDSRKQVYMVFAVAAVGCIIFVAYAGGLFLRYKSREVGVLLALGTEKKKVRKALISEITKCTAAAAVIGLIAGCILSWMIGMVFGALTESVTDYSYGFTLSGILGSLLFGLLIFLMLLFLTARFMKRSNIMDILNEQRKQEPLKRMVTTKYLVSGIILLVAGVLMGFVLPVFVTNLTGHYLGPWTNLFYLGALIGIYQILVYSVSCHRRGRNPQNYYNNVISYGMLKFQGRSIVRNMLVITLLLLGGLFAAFYVPMNTQSMNASLASFESMYSYFYTEDAKVPSRADVEKLAEKYGVTIDHYRQAEWVQAVGSGVNRDDTDENGNLQDIYEKKHGVYEIMSAENFEKMTGQKVNPKQGTYYMIQSKDAEEMLFFRFDDMDSLYLDKTDTYMPMEYAGNLTYQSLVQGRGFDQEARFVVSDQDYQKIKKGTGQFPREKQVLFESSRGDGALAFSTELYKVFGQNISADMKVCSAYDAYQSLLQGEDYGYAGMVRYDPENPVKEADWQYEPTFLVLKESSGMATFAVYMLLFLYVSVICLAAVGVISFARSQSVGLSSKGVFADLEKLGANHGYLRKLLRKQVQKVYVLPTFIGGFGILAFEVLMLKINDGRLMAAELKMIPLFVIIVLAVFLYQYVMYRFSLRKVENLLDLAKE